MSYNQKPPGPGGSNSGIGGAPNGSNNQTPQQVAKTLAGIQQQMQNLVHGQNTLPQTSQADLNAFFQQQRIQNMFKQQQQQLLQQHFQQQMQQQQNKDRGSGEPLALTRTPAAADLLNKTYQQHHQQQANGNSVSNPGLTGVNQQFQQQLQAFPPNIMQQLQAFQFQMQQQQHPQQPQHPPIQPPSIQQAHQSQPHQSAQLQAQSGSQQQLHGQSQQQKAAAAHMQQLQSLQQKYLSAAAAASQPTSGNKMSTTTPPPSLTNQIKPPNLPPSTQITPVSVSTGSTSSISSTSKSSTIPSSTTVCSVAAKQVSPSISLLSTKPLTTAPTSSLAQQQNKLNVGVNKTPPVVNVIAPPFPTQYQKSTTAATSGGNNSTSSSHSPPKISGNIENIISKGNSSIKQQHNIGQSNNTVSKPMNTSAADNTLNSNQATSQSSTLQPVSSKPLQHISENGNKIIAIISSGTNNDNQITAESTKHSEDTLVENTENKIRTDQLKPTENIKSSEPKNTPEPSKSTEPIKISESITVMETTQSIEPTHLTENVKLAEQSKSTELIKPTLTNMNKSVVPLQTISDTTKIPFSDESPTSNVTDDTITVKETNKEEMNEKSSTNKELKSVPIQLIEKEDATTDLKDDTLEKSSAIINADSRQNAISCIEKNNKTEDKSKHILDITIENCEEHLKHSTNLLYATKLPAGSDSVEKSNSSTEVYTDLKQKPNNELQPISEVKESLKENEIEKPINNVEECIESTTEHSFEIKTKSATSESITSKDCIKDDAQINVNHDISAVENSAKKTGRLVKSSKTSSAIIKKETNLKYNSREEKRSIKQKEVSPTSNKKLSDRKSQRHRLKTILYQSPLPELAYITKLSASEASNSPKPVTIEDKLIVFYKNEYMAVRNAEGTFYLCQTMQNVYRTSPRISIRWLSEDKKDSSIYIPDFYDHTDIECVLTTVELKRVDKGHLRLPKTEKSRIESILKKAIDVEKGIVPRPDITEENPDGLDISLYKDESQIEKKNIDDVSPSTSGRSFRHGKSVKLSSTLTTGSKRKRTSTSKSPIKKRKALTNRKKGSKNGSDEESSSEESDTEYKPNQKRASNTTKSSPRAQRSPLAKTRAVSPNTPTSSKNVTQATSTTTNSRLDRANKRKSTIETSLEVSASTKKSIPHGTKMIIKNKVQDEPDVDTTEKKTIDPIIPHSTANNSLTLSSTSLTTSNLGGTRPTRNRK